LKAMQRFPGVAPNRWGQICLFIEQTAGGRFTELDATEKFKSMCSMRTI
jgi:hypothetical protein